MWENYNPNPAGRKVDDCAVRAVAAALGLSWEQAFVALCVSAYQMCDMPSSDEVWGAVLRKHGFYRHACSDCGTAEKFARAHPVGVYVVKLGASHVAAIVDGVLLDAWSSAKEYVIYYWSREVT